MRARTGTRIEETAALCDQVEATIREIIPAKQVASIVDNLGLPYSGINLAYSTSAPVGPGDADIYVNLSEDHKPTVQFVRLLRKKLAATYPSTQFSFLPADMIGQILNFGLPSPIDIQVVGFNTRANREFSNNLLQKLRGIPGAVDLHIHQAGDYPSSMSTSIAPRRSWWVSPNNQWPATCWYLCQEAFRRRRPSGWIPIAEHSIKWLRRRRNTVSGASMIWAIRP